MFRRFIVLMIGWLFVGESFHHRKLSGHSQSRRFPFAAHARKRKSLISEDLVASVVVAADTANSQLISTMVKENPAVHSHDKRQQGNPASTPSRHNMKLSETETPSLVSVDVQNVGILFGDRCLLKNMSFVMKSGDRVGIVGPNGSGKVWRFGPYIVWSSIYLRSLFSVSQHS